MSLIRTILRRPRFSADEVADLRNPNLWIGDALGKTTASGETVTSSAALTLSAHFACCRLRSEDPAKLPIQLRSWRADRGSDLVTNHPVAEVLVRPNVTQSWFDFERVMLWNMWAWGNGYAKIERDQGGGVVALWPVHPSVVAVKGSATDLVYEIKNNVGGVERFDADRMLHFRMLGHGLEGMSVVQWAAESYGIGIAAQRYGGAFYGEGMTQRLIAMVPQVMSREGRAGLRKRLQSASDEPGSRKIPILEGDVKVEKIGIPPGDAQFLETREFQIEEVARWHRVPLQKIQYHKRAQGWSTLDAENTAYVIDSLMPTIAMVEAELRYKLLEESERKALYVKHVLQGLMRGDFVARTTGYSTLRNIGVLSANDIRELEDMNPIEEDDGAGDLYYVQGAMVPMRDPGDEEEDEPEEPGEPPVPEEDEEDEEGAPDGEEPGTDDGGNAGAWSALRPVIHSVVERLASKEALARSRVAKHPGQFDTWADRFYAGWVEQAGSEMVPAIDALSALSGSSRDRLAQVVNGWALGVAGVARSTPPPWSGTVSERASDLSLSLLDALEREVTCG